MEGASGYSCLSRIWLDDIYGLGKSGTPADNYTCNTAELSAHPHFYTARLHSTQHDPVNTRSTSASHSSFIWFNMASAVFFLDLKGKVRVWGVIGKL